MSNGATVIEVWGLAAGHGSTRQAARGAFTCREYNSEKEANDAVDGKDWLEVITYRKKNGPARSAG